MKTLVRQYFWIYEIPDFREFTTVHGAIVLCIVEQRRGGAEIGGLAARIPLLKSGAVRSDGLRMTTSGHVQNMTIIFENRRIGGAPGSCGLDIFATTDEKSSQWICRGAGC